MALDAMVMRWIVALALIVLAGTAAMADAAARAEQDACGAWVERHIVQPDAAPFSFVYGGRPSAACLADWVRSSSSRPLDAARVEHTVTWSARSTGLRVRMTAVAYRDLPAVEWTVRFANTGQADALILEDIQALDARMPAAPMETQIVHSALGDSNSADSFRPMEDLLAPGGRVALACEGGRSSEGRMPFLNLQGRHGGVAIAIGWTGQWAASFAGETAGAVQMRAGMEHTRLRLHPGEEIRSPRILLVFWQGGDALRGTRLMRRTLIEHVTPRRHGQVVFPPICGTVGELDPDGTYEGPHVRVMKPLAERGIEVFWSDMDPQQWYPGGFPSGTGTWEPDPAKYPRGLKPVGDAAKAAGLGYLLWFEPERVARGSQIAREHPEWVSGGAKGGLFRLDMPAARQWITDKIDVQITQASLSWVRWDFNIQPLSHWRRADAPDRQGMTEIRHVEGLYAMWDELEKRHPGLLLDICASGGRRLDIEMLSRGLPLWHSDLQCEGAHPEADQVQNAALYRWLPLHSSGMFGLEPSYNFRSIMTTGSVFCLGAHGPEVLEGVKRSVAMQKKLRPYTLGDFHPLTPHTAATDRWFAFQFNRPDRRDGYVIAFRRPFCAEPALRVHLEGIEPGALYEVVVEDTGARRTMRGSELADLALTVQAAPGSTIVTYRAIGRGR